MTRTNKQSDLISAVEIKYYNLNGSLADVCHYQTVEAAFEHMVNRRMEALAHPVGTTSGAYDYRPAQEGHTLERFKAKLGCCCNDPAEYHDRVAKLGWW